jgi:hypothetical protein
MCPAESTCVESFADEREQLEGGYDAGVFLQRAHTHAEPFCGVVGKAHEAEWSPETSLHESSNKMGLDKTALHLASCEARRFAVEQIDAFDTWRRRAG